MYSRGVEEIEKAIYFRGVLEVDTNLSKNQLKMHLNRFPSTDICLSALGKSSPRALCLLLFVTNVK